MELYNKTIYKTVDLDLCVSCGICKGYCPVEAIEMKFSEGQYLPNIDNNKCILCGKCKNVCPGLEVDFNSLYEYYAKKKPDNIFVGNCLDSYIAYTKDNDIRKKSASGGVITSLILELIKKEEYKKAFVVKFDKIDGREIKSKATDDLNEINNAAKSKYLPVSVEEVIKYVLDNKKDKIIVVGTSCHIHGIKKFLIEERLNEDNILFLGLFCEKTLNYNLIEYYKDKYSAEHEKLDEFNYKNKEDAGWPGNTKMKFDTGREVFINKNVRMELKQYFQLTRCLYCIDKLNQLADISFGDCYIKGEESELGKSNLIVRTEKGKNALICANEYLNMSKIHFEEIVFSQNINKKHKNLSYALSISDEHILYPNIDIEYDCNYNKLREKKRNIKLGKFYLKAPKRLHKILFINKIKKRIRSCICFLGLKDGVKKLYQYIKGSVNNG